MGPVAYLGAVVGMLTLQELADIACRHDTAMARAMVRACLGRALVTGEPLRMPRGHVPPPARTEPVAIRVGNDEWERLVRHNSDTRGMHQ